MPGLRLYAGVTTIVCCIGVITAAAVNDSGSEVVRAVLLSVGCVGVVAGLVWLVVLFVRQCLFPVHHYDGVVTEDFESPSQLVKLGEKYPALLLSPRRQPDKEHTPELIFIWMHGNAMTIGDCEGVCQHLCDALLAQVLIPEYPGYGLFKLRYPNSSPTVSGINSIASQAFTYATETLGFDPKNVVAVGHSIGSGPASELARRHNVGGVALISPFASLPLVVSVFVSLYTCEVVGKVVGFLVRPCTNWCPADALQEAACPVLLIHGAQDSLISCAHSLTLLKTIGGSDVPDTLEHDQLKRYGRVWIRISSTADHVDWSGGPDILTPLVKFVLSRDESEDC
eukprot:Rhum_TRINITY_DN18601_c0_g1::Rhum_TRINITY_DN18601_c0_g1_i1::g.167822::m.167822